MATTFAYTPKRVPIAGWMLKANPAVFDVGTALADSPQEGDWRWTCYPTYRVGLVDTGQPTFLWVTMNDNAVLTSGIWLVGQATGPCFISSGARSVLWRDVKRKKGRSPYLPMRMHTLAQPITRDALLEHPLLRDLETLRMPQMSNPQIITPAQLNALRSDFDLTSAPLTDAVRDAIRSEYPAELWVLGPDDADIEADVSDGAWKVWVDGAEVSVHGSRGEAYAAAAHLARPNLPVSSELTDWTVLAVQTTADEVAMVYRTGAREFIVDVEIDGDDAEYEWEQKFSTLADAITALGAECEDD